MDGHEVPGGSSFFSVDEIISAQRNHKKKNDEYRQTILIKLLPNPGMSVELLTN